VTRACGVLLLLVLLVAPPLRGNGGTVRISNAALGPYTVTIYSSPTPLRTGEVDVSVMVQDSAGGVLIPAVMVVARPLQLSEGATAESIRKRATRAEATNKLFQAAKFDVDEPGDWEFTVEVEGAGSLSFSSAVVPATLLDRPYLLAMLVLLPLILLGWLMLGRDDED
jgi:hypothetical protein